MVKASGLGKGLSTLISERKLDVDKFADNTGKRSDLKISEVFAGKYQPRIIFDEEELNELSESIKRHGVLQPILVKKRDKGIGYEIIAGERRWRATKTANLKEIPAVILDVDDRQAMEIALVENVQRQNLKVIEEAEGYKKLIKEFDYTQEQLADVIGKSRSHVTNIIRLTGLPDEVKDMLNGNRLTAGHARALLSAPNATEAANDVIKNNLSVRQTESYIRKLVKSSGSTGSIRKKSYSRKKKNDIEDVSTINPQIKPDGKAKEEEIILFEKEISKIFGSPVTINDRVDGGEVVIKYKSMEELNQILQKLED